MSRITSTKCFFKSGFTLIELLIVIAIILILIAIALPNFLEAQMRAKVAKAKAEGKTYANALEAYKLDFGGYPRDHDSIWPHPIAGQQNGYMQLTSPIKYLSSLPRDPFGEMVTSGGNEAGGVARNRALYYEGGSGSDETSNYDGRSGGQCGNSTMLIYRDSSSRRWSSARCVHAYLVICIGPDADDGTSGAPAPGPGGNDNFPYNTLLHIYSPTNGTRSVGDIYKVVGEWRRTPSVAPGLGVYLETGPGVIVRYSGEE